MRAYVIGEELPYRVEFVMDGVPAERRSAIENRFKQDGNSVEALIGNFAVKSQNPNVVEDLDRINGLEVIKVTSPNTATTDILI